MQYYPFDSRNSLYRSKIGALAEGEALRLRLLLHRDARVHTAFLCLKSDFNGSTEKIALTPAEWLEDYRFYDCELTLPEGLFWYSFCYTSDYGEFKVYKTESSLGIITDKECLWQQTVFCKDFTTPEWLRGGIIYQIFPDRFCFSGEEKENIPNDRFICKSYEKQPEYIYEKDNPQRIGNDYYRGDFKGIEQKLDYLAGLGVSCIYLNPIFEAHSNHRYNTADYFKTDPLLGTEAELSSLIEKAREKSIYIILDGVFSHTGDDSVYFNAYGRYPQTGAAQSQSSPYYSWYSFKEYPDKYNAWWGVPCMPEVNENNPDFTEFITGENGVIRYWLKKGIKGWRIDVADELPDEFLDRLRTAVKAEGEENYLLGEVWEDATNKISYGVRRRFLRGKQLDSVMNYPLANAIVSFICGNGAEQLLNTVLNILENYPPQAVAVLMNHIGTHDTARILTRLALCDHIPHDRRAQSEIALSDEQYLSGKRRLMLAAVLQFTLPGVPSVYYGDEAGMSGGGDPFCRGFYPWNSPDSELVEFYTALGKARRTGSAFREGEFIPVRADRGFLAFMRVDTSEQIFIAVNRNDFYYELPLPPGFENNTALLGEQNEWGKINLPPLTFTIVKSPRQYSEML